MANFFFCFFDAFWHFLLLDFVLSEIMKVPSISPLHYPNRKFLSLWEVSLSLYSRSGNSGLWSLREAGILPSAFMVFLWWKFEENSPKRLRATSCVSAGIWERLFNRISLSASVASAYLLFVRGYFTSFFS